jgi:hypothetical protein
MVLIKEEVKMAKKYIEFKCVGGNPVLASQCTTAWPSDIQCSIPISGTINGDYYNLMVMDGDESNINNWVSDNNDKVTIITKEQADTLGQQIVPPNTERTVINIMDNTEKTYRSGYFDVDNPDNLWYSI